MEMKQNKTSLRETFSNLTSFFNGCKILKYFSDFYNRYFLISLQKCRGDEHRQAKRNTVAWGIGKSYSIFP